MAKPTKKESAITIDSREDADLTLKKITDVTLLIEAEEIEAQAAIDLIREQMVRETQGPREALDLYAKALKAWANKDQKSWTDKHIELNFGKLGFRRGNSAIKLVLAVETIIERLRAKKMQTCIRIAEEVDKEALANYDDEAITDVGCQRCKAKDKFWYQVKREEVK